MNIESKSLKAALSRAIRVSEKRTSLPVLNTVKIGAVKGVMTIAACDLDCWIKATAPCEGDLPDVCVSGRSLECLINGDSVTLGVDKKRLKVSCGTLTASLPTIDAMEFPPFPKLGKAQWVSCSDLAEAIKKVEWVSDPSQIARPMCGGVWIKVDARTLQAAACDGKTLAYVNKPAIASDFEALPDGRYASIICEHLLEDGAMLHVSDNMFAVKTDTSEVHCKQIEGQYFQIHLQVKMEREQLGEWNLSELRYCAETALALAKDKPFCVVKLEPNQLDMRVSLSKQESEFAKICTVGRLNNTIEYDAKRLLNVIKHISEKVTAYQGATICFESGDLRLYLAPMEQL